MLTALDAPHDKLDDQEKRFIAQVREHGWTRTNVFEDDRGPGFSYTTGFWSGVKAPEIVVFSLKSELAHNILWDTPSVQTTHKAEVCRWAASLQLDKLALKVTSDCLFALHHPAMRGFVGRNYGRKALNQSR